MIPILIRKSAKLEEVFTRSGNALEQNKFFDIPNRAKLTKKNYQYRISSNLLGLNPTGTLKCVTRKSINCVTGGLCINQSLRLSEDERKRCKRFFLGAFERIFLINLILLIFSNFETNLMQGGQIPPAIIKDIKEAHS